MTFGEMTTIHFFRARQQRLKLFCIFLCTFAARWLCSKLGLKAVPTEATVLPQGWLMVNPALAEEIGINKAIIFQYIDGWVQHNRRHNKNIKDGRAWSYNTIPKWASAFSWLNERYVGKLISELENDGRLLSAKLAKKASDQTKYYSTAAGEISDFDAQQLSLWPVENMTLRGRKTPHDSSIDTAKANPSTRKAKTPTPTARKSLTAGGVAEFPGHIPGSEPPERKPEIPEGRHWPDENEQFAATSKKVEAATGQNTPLIPRVPPCPAGDAPTDQDESTEVETASSGNTPAVDVPEWMPSFFTGCTGDELVQLLHRFGEGVLMDAKTYAEDPANRIANPAGFVRARLARGWQPPKGEARSYLSGWGMRGADYISGELADFIEH